MSPSVSIRDMSGVYDSPAGLAVVDGLNGRDRRSRQHKLKVVTPKLYITDSVLERRRADGCCKDKCINRISWEEHRRMVNWYIDAGQMTVKNVLL